MRNLPIQTSNRGGFTIIEVVLVLAIAGLIFLMVFIALPNMQMAQRNTQRRNDYNSLSTQITNYATNHNGAAPAAGTTSVKSTWFNSKGQDPDGNKYKATVQTTVTSGTTGLDRSTMQAYVFTSATNGYDCSNNGDVKQLTGDKKKFVIKGYIEAGGSNGDFVCLESHI